VAIDKIERLTELYQLLDNQPSATQSKQQGAIDALTSRSGGATPEEYVSAADGDPAVADTLLRMSLEKAQKSQDSAAIESIQQALASLGSKFGEQIAAGVNTAAAISLFTTQPEQKQAMRQIYYNSVIGQQSSGSIFDALLDKFGKEGFMPALRTLQRALADDIAALAPSMTPVALRKVLSGLNDTRSITHTMSAVDTLLQRMNSKYPHISLDGSQLTRRLLNLTQNGFYARDLTNLGQEVAGPQPQHQSVFFNQLLPLLQQLPATLWRDDKNRGSALTMLRSLIGEYVTWEQKMARQTKTSTGG
jgi:type III secretion protein W